MTPLPLFFEAWTRHRYLGEPRPAKPAHITKAEFPGVIAEWEKFDEWAAWVDSGRKTPRPMVWLAVPPDHWPNHPEVKLDAWTLGRLKLAHDRKPPVQHDKPGPPPAARSPWLNPPWLKTGSYITWGFVTGEFTPEQIARKAYDHGYGWQSLEGFPAVQGGLDNESYHDRLRTALHTLGLAYGIWERSDQMRVQQAVDIVRAHRPDFYEADIETFPLAIPDFPAQFATAFPGLPRRVLIAGMPDASFCKPWIDAGWDCATQAYTGPNPQQTALNMDNDARWRGWGLNASGHHTWPVLEINADGGKPLAAQLPDVAPWGRAIGVYADEFYTEADWEAA